MISLKTSYLNAHGKSYLNALFWLIRFVDCHLRNKHITIIRYILQPWKYPPEYHCHCGSSVLQGNKFSTSNQSSLFSAQIFAVNRQQSIQNVITHNNYSILVITIYQPPTLKRDEIKTNHISCCNILKVMIMKYCSNLVQLFSHCLNSKI